MLEFLVIVQLIALVTMGIMLRKALQQQAQLMLSASTIKNEPDALVVALGQIPEGNYQAFVTNPEAFAKAHAIGERVALMESYLTDDLRKTLKAASDLRTKEYDMTRSGWVRDAAIKREQADALEERALKLSGDVQTHRSAQLRAIED